MSENITIDGVSYGTEQFSTEVKQAISIYSTISSDLQKAQLEVIKCQSAMQSIGEQVTKAIKAELATQTESAPEESAEEKQASEE